MAPAPIASGVGIANLPNQRHKIVAKLGSNFTIMVCGKLPSSCRERHVTTVTRYGFNSMP
jgi:septin family protein